MLFNEVARRFSYYGRLWVSVTVFRLQEALSSGFPYSLSSII